VFRRAARHTPIWDPSDPAPGEFIGAVSDDEAYTRAVPFPTFHPDDPALGERLADLVESAVLQAVNPRRSAHT
jgi:hypothetical protein